MTHSEQMPTTRRWLAACRHLSRCPREPLTDTAREVRTLVGADTVTVWLTDGDFPGPLWTDVKAAARRAMAEASPSVVTGAGGSTLVVPIGLPGHVRGVLVLGRGPHRAPFPEVLGMLAQSYVSYNTSREVAELGDRLIRLAFSAGLSLSGSLQHTDDPRVEEGIRAALASLDESVALIRAYVHAA
ncbi:hypothetical protein HFP15_25760 [Amycolatopsis sp. K13G38]|uniref:Uncharacterized protein n=1 Tax=Amycolatopsis acididurans TaxID=2724524 RepID=A0ABX1JD31_9PSEU|nr:hypothetical protein [Amycolatopsis acididurans]NKQ56290.1 hypothetical protein [Amycolatopsis acididurans]